MLSDREKRRIINSCQTCRTSIYEGEPTYISSKGRSSGHVGGSYGGKNISDYQIGGYGKHYSGSHASENWIQCAWCYDQWQIELVANKKFWIKWWLGGIFLIFIMTIMSVIMFPGLEKNGDNSATWYRTKFFSLGNWQVSFITPIVIACSLILIKILGNLFQPTTDRYKLRRRPIKL